MSYITGDSQQCWESTSPREPTGVETCDVYLHWIDRKWPPVGLSQGLPAGSELSISLELQITHRGLKGSSLAVLLFMKQRLWQVKCGHRRSGSRHAHLTPGGLTPQLLGPSKNCKQNKAKVIRKAAKLTFINVSVNVYDICHYVNLLKYQIGYA